MNVQNNTPPLTWAQRSHIMEGTAKGLNYLHTLPKPKIHGDIKSPHYVYSANILLDQNMEAKIGDFGLSCEGPSGRYTHCKVTKLQGTQFYLPHEYLKDHHLSDKVDVYSYGIVDYVAEHSRNQILDSLRDQSAGIENMPWFLGLLRLGIDCTSQRKKDRPTMTMAMIIMVDRSRRLLL
ncbi:IRAK1, partial [Cordylochernes scorpioides]